MAWLEKTPHIHCHVTPAADGLRVMSISGATAKPFVWTATADEILAKVRIVQANISGTLA